MRDERFTPQDIRYLKLLGKQYRTIQAASAEVAHLRAVLRLPKGTEHFLSDLHGEHAAFLHILHNASGVIKRKINDLYGNILSTHERDMLSTLIYYPDEKLALLKKQHVVSPEWYRLTIYRLIEVCRVCSVKYTRKRVREAMPRGMGALIEELMLSDGTPDKEGYYREVMQSILETGQADAMIIALSHVIQSLAIDRLHIIGDIFDRGPRADLIMDALENYHQVDVQWGNHDIAWMGAAALSEACIAQVIVTSVKYGNLETLEVGYGISLRPLSTLAMTCYGDDPCAEFHPKDNGEAIQEDEMDLARMHKAAAILQFKLEGQLLQRHPEYNMDGRRLLHRIDFEKGTVMVEGEEYPLRSCHFPTIDPADPYALTPLEREVMDRLVLEFAHSEKLQRHVQFLYSTGGMYLCCNGNLLYHGCIPMEEDGSFAPIPVSGGDMLRGRAGIDAADLLARQGYFAHLGSRPRSDGQDFLWYLGCGPYSPLFGKSKMATFERYFIRDKRAHVEIKNAYYRYQDDEPTALRILEEFGLNSAGFIINGHVPVKLGQGESPIKAGGRLLVIDGGLSRAYQPVTGIAGYTLIFSSHELSLVAHQPFESTASAISAEQDIHSVHEIVKIMEHRLLIADTDDGEKLRGRIDDLMMLIAAYRSGVLKESRAED
ncbi:MAG: fructose-1,6-bisphosphatase [Clostridia bacterium]|nr:fructose-1,6-bisphosphatase [Clostridia bacterium]MBQ4608860.1 fructose-1,6-bisphosphatase [Clostridia bacterium]MBQ7051868.1 fructose-1,6-bisphosphatase [Clostridia bacterium]